MSLISGTTDADGHRDSTRPDAELHYGGDDLDLSLDPPSATAILQLSCKVLPVFYGNLVVTEVWDWDYRRSTPARHIIATIDADLRSTSSHNVSLSNDCVCLNFAFDVSVAKRS